MIQITVLILGAIFAVAGIALFAKRGISGKNSIKVGGMEFQLAGSSLVVFVVGCGLILVAARMQSTAPAQETSGTGNTRTQTPAPELTPPTGFVARFKYRPDMIERTEYERDPGQPAVEKIDDFLRVTAVTFGRDSGGRQIFQITVTLKNTSTLPVQLDLTERFFGLVDNRGKEARLAYFCCSARGDLLSPGQEREIQLFFEGSGWEGKSLSANYLLFRVQGLLPIMSATWKFPTLATRA
ncbi:MAG: hypothetical protein DME97_03075 [Verrucomicrobia bacterium]|nr:MAG: hypothetical protein DME97_03075 [Verrucomicrobiota bacterium]